MATKLEIKGNFLFITEGSDSPERFISRITSYGFNSTQTELLIRQPEGSNQVTFKYKVSDLVDSEGNPYSKLEDVETFLNENLGGFNSALGGSEADDTEYDINAGYRGVFDASTNSYPTDVSPVNGDWYYVGIEGTIDSNNYKVNDIIKYNESTTSWEKIENKNATVTEIENSALEQFNIHVDANYSGTISNGSALYPYNDLATAMQLRGKKLKTKTQL